MTTSPTTPTLAAVVERLSAIFVNLGGDDLRLWFRERAGKRRDGEITQMHGDVRSVLQALTAAEAQNAKLRAALERIETYAKSAKGNTETTRLAFREGFAELEYFARAALQETE